MKMFKHDLNEHFQIEKKKQKTKKKKKKKKNNKKQKQNNTYMKILFAAI